MEATKPCPFCGGRLDILIGDDEGNIKDEDYELDPWGGLSYILSHDTEANPDCPIANHRGDNFGFRLYDTKEDAILHWNKRHTE